MELQCSSCTYLHLTRLCVLKRNVCCDVASFVVCAETRNCRSRQATVPQSVSSSGLAAARALCCGSTDVRQMPWRCSRRTWRASSRLPVSSSSRTLLRARPNGTCTHLIQCRIPPRVITTFSAMRKDTDTDCSQQKTRAQKEEGGAQAAAKRS